MAAVPARYVLERAAWREAAALAPRASPYPYAEAIGYFARALGAAHTGALALAREDLAKLTSLCDADLAKHQDYGAGQTTVLNEGGLGLGRAGGRPGATGSHAHA